MGGHQLEWAEEMPVCPPVKLKEKEDFHVVDYSECSSNEVPRLRVGSWFSLPGPMTLSCEGNGSEDTYQKPASERSDDH